MNASPLARGAHESVQIRTISAEQALPLRHQVLWPNEPMSFCRVEGDESASHYGGYINDRLVCVASIYIDGDQARLRKFATLPARQGQGVGSAVINHIIPALVDAGMRYFWCDARTTAVRFYQRFGFQTEGPAFYKSGLGYYKMALELTGQQ